MNYVVSCFNIRNDLYYSIFMDNHKQRETTYIIYIIFVWCNRTIHYLYVYIYFDFFI